MASAEDREIYRTYASDGALALQDIEQCLLRLEASPRDMGELHRLYRALHTLKGNSALLGLTSIEGVSHAAEDMVGLVRDKGVAFGGELVELMLLFKDRVSTCVVDVGERHCDAPADSFSELVGSIRAWIESQGGTQRAPVGAQRGDFMTFSSAPPRSRSVPALGSLPVMELEGLLGSARELLLALRPSASGGTTVAAFDACEALRLACLRQLEQPLASAAARLSAWLMETPDDRKRMQSELQELRVQLRSLEARRLALTGIPEDFGLEDLCQELLGERSPAATSRSVVIVEPAAPHTRPERPSAAPPLTMHAASFATVDREPPRQRATPADGSTKSFARASLDTADTKHDYLRIDARKLSLLMELAGEISLACGAVTHHPGLPQEMPEGFLNASQKLELLIRELQNEVSALRLVPVSGVFQRMRRVLRDTCARTGKKVELELLGEDTEIDKVMVDALHDPLVHLVRNAIDHGIETPAERTDAGKPESGRLVLEAMHQGGEVSVQLRDDGRGISRERIRARAEERGLITPQSVLTDAQLLELVFVPGFSTKDKVDELSGRGVGMDVIRTTVQDLRGRVKIESREGHGSCVNMTLPLTLAFVEAMVVREREQLFALPIEKVLEVFKPEPEQLVESSADGNSALRLRDRLIPVLWMHRYFGEASRVDERLEQRVIVVTQAGPDVIAIPVHALLGNQPIMLKPLRGVLRNVRAAAGCGMLRTGDVALVLDTDRLHV